MSLPAEPRQKMINIMYLVLTALLALNVSSEILKAFKVVDGSLKRSNENLSASTADIYASFDNAKKDPKTAAKAAILGPKADSIKIETDKIIKIVENYRRKITDAADPIKLEDGTSGVKKEDNLDIGSRIMGSEGGGEAVFAAIAEYKANVKRIMGVEFEAAFPKGTPLEDKAIKDGKDLAKQNFYMQPVVANLTMMSKTLNDIKNTEGDAVKHLFSRIDGVVIRLNKFAPLVSTNSTYLMPGEDLIVSAGVGAFNDDAKPQISIGGSGVPTGEDGMGSKTFKVGTTGGTVPVVINFKDPNTGETKTITKSVTYTVGTPGGASVSADKMNVMYIGVVNPITVASGKGWDKTKVSMEGGSISSRGGNGLFNATVSTPGIAYVVVNMDGNSPAKFPFRVKYLPPAAAGIGQNLQQEGTMPAASFRAMGGIRAALVGSEFDATYTIVSYNIIGSGPGFNPTGFASNNGSFWSGAAATVANKAVPGSTMAFTNIIVKGPDGRDVKAANSTIVIRCN